MEKIFFVSGDHPILRRVGDHLKTFDEAVVLLKEMMEAGYENIKLEIKEIVIKNGRKEMDSRSLS